MSTKKGASRYKIDSRRWPGVYGYDSTRRKYFGKPDTCYYINYKGLASEDNGKLTYKLIWEKIGWRSEGITPQIAAEERGAKLRKLRHGEAAKTNREIKIDKLRSDRTLAEIADTYFESRHGKNIKGRRNDFNRYHKNLSEIR